ncbi:unnamed protein product [Merluccius merluccius]
MCTIDLFNCGTQQWLFTSQQTAPQEEPLVKTMKHNRCMQTKVGLSQSPLDPPLGAPGAGLKGWHGVAQHPLKCECPPPPLVPIYGIGQEDCQSDNAQRHWMRVLLIAACQLDNAA